MHIDTLIAQQVRDLRKARLMTLEQLAELSGVSRSMISLIERQETSPTASVLNKLATALGVTLATLFAEETADRATASPLARASDHPTWQDPASGYVRRNLSPGGYDSPIELVEIEFPARQSVTFDNIIRHQRTCQQVWMLEGQMAIQLGHLNWSLHAGDCLAMELGQQIVFSNPTDQPARYLLALATFPTYLRKNG